MDMVAVPDFSAGAMENWGLVTYRTVAVLLDEKNSDSANKYRLAETVQHELAHQWFGNLVTMDFWEGLWLNEGFATWMSWYSCNAFYPEWKVWDGYVTDNWQQALSLDSRRSSHPIEVPVKVADEINQIFDEISYSKGSCVIRMISKYLGEDVFMEGIRKYLKKHAFGNTTTMDLWAALSEASGKDVEKIGSIWTKEVGFPVVTVTEDAAANTIHVKQNRFLRTADVKPEEDKVLYPIILGLRTKDGINRDLILQSREESFKVPDLDFFKLNAEQSGIYRTLYTPERLQKLGEAAKAGLLPVPDRAGLIADAGALSQAGYQRTSSFLSFLQSFDSEPELQVWEEIIARVSVLQSTWLFEGEDINKALLAFKRELVSKRAHEIGWTFSDQDGLIEQQFKSLLFASACEVDDEKAIAAATDMFNKFRGGDRKAINPNLRRTVFATVIRRGGKEEYEAVLKEYETAKTSVERNGALSSLGASKDPELTQRTLQYAWNEEVKSQDIYLLLGGLRRYPETSEALWTWTKAHWDTLREKFPTSVGMIGTILKMSVTSFTKDTQKADVEKFFQEKGAKGIDMDLAQALDAIKAKQGWLQRDAADVQNWLKEKGYLGRSKI
jgi:aminopeptidase 2